MRIVEGVFLTALPLVVVAVPTEELSGGIKISLSKRNHFVDNDGYANVELMKRHLSETTECVKILCFSIPLLTP